MTEGIVVLFSSAADSFSGSTSCATRATSAGVPAARVTTPSMGAPDDPATNWLLLLLLLLMLLVVILLFDGCC